MKSCFFIGHHDAPDSILPELTKAIEGIILEEDEICFYIGGYGNFDRLSVHAVKQLKQKYPQITLMKLLYYHPAIRPVEIPYGYDGTYYPEGMESVPPRIAIVKGNQLMVDSVDWLVAYICHSIGNAGKLLKYAQRKKCSSTLHIINLSNNITQL